MKYIIPTLTLLSGLVISCIAGFYSVLGLAAIFSGAATAIYLLGGSLEIAKVITTITLHKHWNDSLGLVKYYLVIAVLSLMAITSMGTFGYLSKASMNQSASITTNSSTVDYIESTIVREQAKLDSNMKQLDTYNDSMSRLITDNPTKAAKERKRIQGEIRLIQSDNKTISNELDKLNTQLLPYKTEIKKLEVEVGPILFISKLFYGEDYKNHLTQTLTVLIILIVLVFDPLAIALLIASQKSFKIVRGVKAVEPEPDQSPYKEDPEYYGDDKALAAKEKYIPEPEEPKAFPDWYNIPEEDLTIAQMIARDSFMEQQRSIDGVTINDYPSDRDTVPTIEEYHDAQDLAEHAELTPVIAPPVWDPERGFGDIPEYPDKSAEELELEYLMRDEKDEPNIVDGRIARPQRKNHRIS